MKLRYRYDAFHQNASAIPCMEYMLSFEHILHQNNGYCEAHYTSLFLSVMLQSKQLNSSRDN